MQVHLQPVRWTVGKGISLDQLFARLATVSPQHELHEFKGKFRRLYTGRQGNYHVGMMLSSKDHKNTCETELTPDGKLKIDVNRGNPNRPATDFNFLAVHHQTGRGLYMHYHQSCPFDRFSSFCREHYDALKAELVEQEIAGSAERRAVENAKRKYARSLKAELLVRQDKVADLLQTFNEIVRLDLSAVELQSNEPWANADVNATVRSVSHRFNFIRDVPVTRQRAAADRLISALGARRGRIIGEASDGIEKIVKLSRNVDSFGNIPFDVVAENMVFDAADLASAWPVVQIIDTINASAPYFEHG